MKFREITIPDIPAIFEVRMASNENNFTHKELEEGEISIETVEEKLKSSCKGWLCEIENEIVGFIIANKKTAEIGILAVLPTHKNKQIESRLLNLAEHWLLSSGKNSFQRTSKDPTSLSFN